MKKMIFSLVAVAMVAVTGVNVYKVSASEVEMSDIQKENVEALAGCEIQDGKGNIVYECEGSSNRCSISRLGFTLICDGKSN